jgi:hypothetical protein
MSEADYTSRQDWTPNAQPPGPDGVIAHTQDPTRYFNAGNRTIIPRAAVGENFGASQGVMPTVIHVDPTNPAMGQGGVDIDMQRLDQALVKRAAEMGRTPQERMAAYVKLANEQAALPAASPARSPVAVNPQPAVAPAVLAPPPYVAHNPPQAPVLPAAPASIVPEAAQLNLLSTLETLLARNAALVPPTPPQPVSPAPLESYVARLEMPFLTLQPSSPGVAVIYHFPHGKFKTSYHEVVRSGKCLSLVYDNRLEGHSQYVPEPLVDQHGNHTPIRLQVPSKGLDLQVCIDELTVTIGCLDVVNLLVVGDNADQEEAAASLAGHADLTGA